MEFTIKEYNEYHEQEILNLYKSVGWVNYVNHPEMLKNAYESSLKILGAYNGEKLLGIFPCGRRWILNYLYSGYYCFA